MNEEDKRKIINEFFTAPEPFHDIKSILCGSALALVGIWIALSSEAVGFGMGSAFVGVLWAVLLPIFPKWKNGVDRYSAPSKTFSLITYKAAKSRFERRPTLEQMHQWLNQDIKRYLGESLDRLGIDIEDTNRDAIYVLGPLYTSNVEGISDSLVLRRLTGESYFYSTYKLTVFHFTDRFLGAYQANYNMIKNVTTGEETDEFFYIDVVAVKTQTKASNYTLKSGEKLESAKMFSLSVSNGDRIQVVINDPVIKVGADIESIGDGAVNNIRAMLRQYKAKMVHA